MNKEYSISIDGEPVTFEFKDSLIHAEGDHAGNIDAIITTKPPLPQNLLLDELHIKIPDTNEFLYIYGFGVVENSIKATFNSSSLVDKQKLPETVGVYWGANGEQFIGEMCCQRYSETAEHDLSDELEEEFVSEEKVEKTDEPKQVKNEDKDIKIDNKTDNKEVQKNEINFNYLYIAGALIVLLSVFVFIL